MSEESGHGGESSSRGRGAGGSRKGHRIRLYHNKSRAGCQRCKARRVKCDEQRPVCGACQRHGVECIYEESQLPAAAASSSSRSESRAASVPRQARSIPVPKGAYLGPLASPDIPSDTVYGNHLLGTPGIRELRLFELRLIHHYVANIAYSSRSAFRYNSNPIAQPSNFPHLFGFIISNENILFAVLALSATHLLFTGGGDTQQPESSASTSRMSSPSLSSPMLPEIADPATLARAREDYLFIALSEQREAVANLNVGNINAVCFASMIIMTNEVAGLADRDLDPYEPPMKWLQMGRGVGTVFDTAQSRMGVLDPGWGANTMNIVDPKLEDGQTAEAALLRMGETGRMLLTPTNLPGEDLSDETYEVYDYAVKYIGVVLSEIDVGREEMFIAIKCLAFPAWEPNQFVDYVAERRPRALVTLAHVLRLAQGYTGTWWLGSTPEREIAAIWNEIPPEWRFMMPDARPSI